MNRTYRWITVAVGLVASSMALAPLTMAAVPPFTTIGSYTAGTPQNNPFNVNWYMPEGSNREPLAWTKNTANPNAFWATALATHWKLSANGDNLTVWLRPQAKWSNGAPVTAKDAAFTMAAEDVTGKNTWNLYSVTVVNPHEFILSMKPGTHYNLFENQALQQNIEPQAAYPGILPSNIWTIIHESQYTGSNAARKALAAKAKTTISRLSNRLEAYEPAKDISDGPFILTQTSPSQQLMVKNPYFWGAKRIKINQVILYNLISNQVGWNLMESAKTDEATSAMPITVRNSAAHHPGNHFFAISTYGIAELVFNQHVYPYNMTAVRQALAYLINRHNVGTVAAPYAKHYPIKYFDGLSNGPSMHELTTKQLHALNPYHPNPAKAAALLKSAGFHKNSAGHWLLPNGRPWTAAIYMAAGNSDWVEAGTVMAHEMTAFGIPTATTPVSNATYAAEQLVGKYGMSFLFGEGGPQPFDAFNSYFTTADGYSLIASHVQYSSSVAQNNWVNFPQTVGVKGYGKVKVGPLAYALEQTSNTATVKADTAKLAAATNQYVPMIPLFTEMVSGFYNTNFYTDWPVKNTAVMRGQFYFAPFFWMQMGYVHPR